MVAARYIVFVVSTLYSIWCVLVAALTLAGKNVATGHLLSLYPLAYAAIYLVLSPFGLSGILGALNRKKSLIKGFIFQYWIGVILLTAMNCVSVYWAHNMATSANRQCQNNIQWIQSPNASLKSCTYFIKTAQLASLIFTSVQGGIMLIFGILLTIYGLREAEDIKLDEETSSLLDKAAYQAKPKPSNLSELRNVHRSNSNSSDSTNASSNHSQASLSRNTTNASSNYSRAGLSRNTTNASSNHSQDGLSRNTTNASNYGPNRQNLNTYNNFNRTANGPSVKYRDLRPPQINTNVGQNFGPNRGPFFAPNYMPPARNQIPPGHGNDSNAYIYMPPQVLTRPQTPNAYDQYPTDDYQNYWQPGIAKVMAADLTRKGLY
jgi:hypothetical protein